MTGRRSHGRLSALNGVVHQGTANARHHSALNSSKPVSVLLGREPVSQECPPVPRRRQRHPPDPSSPSGSVAASRDRAGSSGVVQSTRNTTCGWPIGSISGGFQGTHGPRRAWKPPLRQATALSGAGGRAGGARRASVIGDGLRARSPAGPGSEVVLDCEILNRMTEFGRPVSYCIAR